MSFQNIGKMYMDPIHCLNTDEQALLLAHNALCTNVDEDGFYHFFRFSENQKERLGTHALYRAMLNSSADIVLRLRTISKVVLLLKRFNRSMLPKEGDIELNFSALSEKPFDLSETLDVHIADKGLERRPLANQTIQFEDMREVSIHLPLHHHVGVKLEGFWQPRQKKRKTLLCLGDSIIQGVGIHHSSRSLGQNLSQLLDCEVINQGLAGSLINPKVVEQLSFSSPLFAILVHLGTNDWVVRENLASLRWDMFALLGRLRKYYKTVPIVLLTPLWRADIQQDKAMGSFTELSKALVQASRCFPNVRIADGLSLSLRSNYDDQFLHPDEKATAFLAKALLPYF